MRLECIKAEQSRKILRLCDCPVNTVTKYYKIIVFFLVGLRVGLPNLIIYIILCKVRKITIKSKASIRDATEFLAPLRNLFAIVIIAVIGVGVGLIAGIYKITQFLHSFDRLK